MKYNLCYKKIFFTIFFIKSIFLSTALIANINDKMENITSKLRCMTCQNQTIYSSDAEFSNTIKKLVKEKLKNNETENEIIDFLIARYGEYILFEPKMSKQNIFLWIFPFVILGISLVFLAIRIKKNT